MSTPLLPQAFWFRLALPCRRIDGLPRIGSGGGCSTSPRRAPCPTCAAGGARPWAEVRVAWNPAGLAVAVEAKGKPGPIDLRRGPDARRRGPGLGRHARHAHIHRATRFCHRFAAISRRAVADPLDVELAQRPIARAGRRPDRPARGAPGAGRAAERRLAPGTVPAGRGAARLRPRDQPPAGVRLPGVRPRPRGPVPGRRPRVPRRRGPEPLVDPGAARRMIRLTRRSGRDTLGV